jgi:hypothetical protein
VLEAAHQALRERHPEEEIITSAVPASGLATMYLARTMTCITIGLVYVGEGGSADTIPIQLDRVGNVLARLSRSSDPLQRWIAG